MAAIGTIIEGKYEILKLIGKGGMSKVYLAMDKNLNKPWAIKEIDKYGKDKNNEVVVASAIAEANMMKRLDHPLLPRIVDILDYPESIYVVMDYIEGEPLNRILDREGALDQMDVINWAMELCGVLEYLHSQNPPIIYRDMKPANIMLQPSGNIKLIDFGIAREYKEYNLEDTVSLGTKGYAAPEQFGGKGQTDRRTDIYSLGVTLYHLLTGKNPTEPPYEIYPIRYWNAQLSAGLENIVAKCTQLNPDDRFDSCAELMFALSHYEEADDTYRAKQKKKVNLFAAMIIMGVLSMGVGIFGKVMDYNTRKAESLSLQDKAKQTVDEEQSLEYLTKSLDAKGDEIQAYLDLVKLFESGDNVFDAEEESLINSYIKKNESDLSGNSQYDELCFEMGKLYWYYYDISSTNTSEISAHKRGGDWFAKVSENFEDYEEANTYCQIAEFENNISLYEKEGTAKIEYENYYKNLNSFYESIKNEKGKEMVTMMAYRTCLNALGESKNLKNFKENGASKEDVMNLYNKIISSVKEVDTGESGKPAEIKNDLLSHKDSVLLAINAVYQ